MIRQENKIYLVFELANKNILETLRMNKKMGLDEAKRNVYQMLQAVKHMHLNKIIHRDIKPENLLLT